MRGKVSFTEATGGIGFLAAIIVLAYATIVQGSEPALGGILAISAAGAGFFLRGKVERSE